MTHWASYPSLEGRSVLITGGASGIGAQIVRRFCEQKSKVAFIDLDAAAGAATAQAIEHDGLAAPLCLACDLRDITALRAAIARAAEVNGPITVLVNNAARDDRHPAAEVTPVLAIRSRSELDDLPPIEQLDDLPPRAGAQVMRFIDEQTLARLSQVRTRLLRTRIQDLCGRHDYVGPRQNLLNLVDCLESALEHENGRAQKVSDDGMDARQYPEGHELLRDLSAQRVRRHDHQSLGR